MREGGSRCEEEGDHLETTEVHWNFQNATYDKLPSPSIPLSNDTIYDYIPRRPLNNARTSTIIMILPPPTFHIHLDVRYY